MSQQINLLLPELRPRFDWLALPVVLGAALVGLLFVVAMALFGEGDIFFKRGTYHLTVMTIH
jgi:hypothetical protein